MIYFGSSNLVPLKEITELEREGRLGIEDVTLFIDIQASRMAHLSCRLMITRV